MCSYIRYVFLSIGSSISALSVSQTRATATSTWRPRHRGRDITIFPVTSDTTYRRSCASDETLAREIRYTSERFCRSESHISASFDGPKLERFRPASTTGSCYEAQIARSERTEGQSSARPRDEKKTFSRSRRKTPRLGARVILTNVIIYFLTRKIRDRQFTEIGIACVRNTARDQGRG